MSCYMADGEIRYEGSQMLTDALGYGTCGEDKIHALGGRWRVLVSGPHQWWTITSPEVFPFPQLSYPLTLEASSGWLWWSALIPHSRDLSDLNIIIRWVSLNNFDVGWGVNYFPNMSAPFGVTRMLQIFWCIWGVEIDIIPGCMVEWHRVHQIFHAWRQNALSPLKNLVQLVVQRVIVSSAEGAACKKVDCDSQFVSGAKVQQVQSWLKILRLNAALVLIKLTPQNTFENVGRERDLGPSRVLRFLDIYVSAYYFR